MIPRRLLMTTDAVGGVWTYALDLAHDLTKVGVTVSLAVVGIWLVERHVVAALVQRADDPAIVGRGAIPVRRYQARTKKCDTRFPHCHTTVACATTVRYAST